MNPRRAKFATLALKEEVVPVVIHDPNAGEEEQTFTYATIAAVASVSESDHHDYHHHQSLDNGQEVIIDEHGNAVTIQQLVTDDGSSVEEVETVEEADGTHTILHVVPSEDNEPGEVVEGEDINVTIESGGDLSAGEMSDPNASPGEAGSGGLRSKTFYCPNCGNCYSAAGSLKLHMRACMRQRQEVPPEERRCEVCNKVFNSVAYLKEHMLRHTGQGPLRCTRCYRKFIEDDKYKAHLEQHKQQDKLEAEAEVLAAQHGGKKVTVKEFTCSFCTQTFTVVFDAGQVKRRYACDGCREKYSNAEMLKKHKQMIEDKREFPCERCGRKFVFEGFLQRHLPTCDGTIKRRRDLK